MTVVTFFHEDVTKNELEHFERIAITWFRPQFNYPLCQKWIRYFGQVGVLCNSIDLITCQKGNKGRAVVFTPGAEDHI